MSSFQVVPIELESAGSLIGSSADVVRGAESALAGAEAMAGAFGGEAIGGAFTSACGRALAAVSALAGTVSTLGGCVTAAGNGYLVTDHGIIAAGGVPGAVNLSAPGTGHVLVSTWSGQ